ncbi:MAG: UbiA family prenyltransferase [Proteobacteria bacterium]|nr:UbiA family prenyltransferase [Pseudomonadota bacterium]
MKNVELKNRILILVNYFKLFRFDALLISFFTYIIGASLAGKNKVDDVLLAFTVTLISTNFIYSFNSWTDRDIDRINKSYRPIPSGKISQHHAFIYAMFLLICSLIYPFFIFKNAITLLLFLLLPVLGVLYSAEPFRFRKYPLLATITISTGLVIPILLGYLMNSDDYSTMPFFLTLFFYCLAVIPLKQIEEEKEDSACKLPNLFIKYGKNLLCVSVMGLLLNFIISALIISDFQLRLFSLLFNSSTMIVVLLFFKFELKLHRLYTVIIQTVIIESMLLYIALNMI